MTSPLPPRGGLAAARLRLPAGGTWRTVAEHLRERLTRVDPERLEAALRAGEFVDDAGRPVDAATPFVPGMRIWFHRDLPDETPVPFPVTVLHRDERTVVVDKPPFLATIPRGSHVVETVLVRLREELDLPELAPAHRLDRATAGVLLLTTGRRWRGSYQTLFRDQQVAKTYLAVAPAREELAVPTTVRSHIVKERGVIAAREIPGAPVNAVTVVQLVDRQGDLGLYRLRPLTGRTHQLRVHLARLGAPIVGDRIHPVLLDGPEDLTDPLQLLAARLAFTDPVDGAVRDHRSGLSLRWPRPLPAGVLDPRPGEELPERRPPRQSRRARRRAAREREDVRPGAGGSRREPAGAGRPGPLLTPSPRTGCDEGRFGSAPDDR